MRNFEDERSDTWPLNVNAAAMKRIRDQAGIDFVNVRESGNLWDKVIGDPIVLADVLAAVCEPEIIRRGITRDEFLDRLTGRVCHEAAQQLAQEIVDFFLGWSPAIGKLLAKSYDAHRRYMRRANEMVERKLQTLGVDQMVDQATAIAEQEVDQMLADLEKTTGT